MKITPVNDYLLIELVVETKEILKLDLPEDNVKPYKTGKVIAGETPWEGRLCYFNHTSAAYAVKDGQLLIPKADVIALVGFKPCPDEA